MPKRLLVLLLALFLPILSVLSAGAAAPPENWPPAVNKEYPNLDLMDAQGRQSKLKQFQGQVILLEIVGMTCPACNAFAGGNEASVGPFGKIVPQPGLGTVSSLMSRYARMPLSSPNFVHVTVIYYNLKMGLPSTGDVQAWADHFKLSPMNNQYVFAGTKPYQAVANGMIPGFDLIDKNFVLRSDSTGDNPKESLETKLLPMVRRLMQ